jgi:aldose 1-epimerase
MTAPSGRQVRLAAHDQELVVVEVGGGIRTYRAPGRDGRRRDVIDGYGADEMASGGRGQLLAPWPNRLAAGRFEWAGTSLQTAITEVETGNAIHGLVRWCNWTLPEPETVRSPYTPATPVDATSLSYRLHPQPGWPWTLDLRVTYRLIPDHGLEVRTSVTNRAEQPCPVGIGWHPYLTAPGSFVDDCHLTVPAGTAYRADERGIPVERFGVTGTDFDFTTSRPIGPARLDVAFTDLHRDDDGRTRVVVAGPDDDGVCLWLDRNYTHLMVYTGDTLADPGRRRRGLAVEPMTGAPDLLNNGDGRRVLEPDATFDAVWGIESFSNLDNSR